MCMNTRWGRISRFFEASTGSDLNDPNTTPLQQGLVAWYPFDGNASDMSGNGNHGTVNGATLGTDRHGQANMAYSFDGVDDYIVSSGNTFDTQDKGTISLWFNDVSTTNSGGGILGSRRGYVQGDFLIGNLESGDGFRVLFGIHKILLGLDGVPVLKPL